MTLKYISYLEPWQLLYSIEQNNLCNFVRRHREKQFYEIILNLVQWFRRRCRFKIFLIWSTSGTIVQRSRAICAICVEGSMRSNSVKLF